jgi:hypothetical protein
MKKLVLFLIVAITFIYGCNKNSELDEIEPTFKEKYSLDGQVNGVFTDFRKSQELQGIGSPLEDNDSIEFSRGVSFLSLSNDSFEVHIERRVFVPKAQLVEQNTLLNDSIKMYKAQFKNFDDFKNLFQPGIYNYSNKDKIFTYVTIKKTEEDMDWFFSYYQPSSEFTFSIDTLLIDSENEKIYIAGKFNSANSSDNKNIKDIISLKDIEFSACFKNEYDFEPSK